MHNINIELGKGINGLLLILIGVVHVAGLKGRGVSGSAIGNQCRNDDSWIRSTDSGVTTSLSCCAEPTEFCIIFLLNLLNLLVRISGTSSVGSLS